MMWIMFAIGAALCWGVYGPALGALREGLGYAAHNFSLPTNP